MLEEILFNNAELISTVNIWFIMKFFNPYRLYMYYYKMKTAKVELEIKEKELKKLK